MEKTAFGRVAVLLGGAVALTWTSPARAQEFLKDRHLAEGAGYQAGDFDFHPGIAGEIGYESNYFERSDKVDPNLLNAAPVHAPEGSGIVRITPSLSFQTVTDPRRRENNGDAAAPARPPLNFSGMISGTYKEFLNPDMSNERNMSANAALTLAIHQGHPVYGSITGLYNRTIQPTVLGNPDQSYNNDAIQGGADLAIQPDMGTLDWHFGYQFTGILFEDSVATPYNNFLHTVYSRGRWRFRPKTALLYEGTLGWRSYSNSGGAEFALHSTTPITTSVGLEGLVTSRMSILVMGGYAGTFTTGGDASTQQYDSFNGRAEIRFYPSAQSTTTPSGAPENSFVSLIALGYQRTMQASYLNDFYGTDRGYLHVDYSLGGRFLFRVEGGVGAIEHPDLYFGSGVSGQNAPVLMHAAYTDIRADASFYMEYRIVPSVALMGTVLYVENFSNTELPVTADALSGPFYDQSFRDFQAFAGIRWMM